MLTKTLTACKVSTKAAQYHMATYAWQSFMIKIPRLRATHR
jgi:hypothetical protein